MKFNSAQVKVIHKENLRWPTALTTVPYQDWPTSVFDNNADKLINVFRSRTHLVQIFHQKSHGDIIRISVQRTEYDERNQRFKEGITWDTLMAIKTEIGYGDRCAVEVYPPDHLVVNVANLRHLFLLPMGELPNYVWQ